MHDREASSIGAKLRTQESKAEVETLDGMHGLTDHGCSNALNPSVFGQVETFIETSEGYSSDGFCCQVLVEPIGKMNRVDQNI